MQKKGMEQIELGATGQTVARQLKALRESRGLSYEKLSAAMPEDARIAPIGLRRIEGMARRVTVDDLLGLAVALNVSPLTLMLDDVGQVTGVEASVSRVELEAWMSDQTKLDFESLQAYWVRQLQSAEKQLLEIEKRLMSDEYSGSLRDILSTNATILRRRIEDMTARLGELQAITGKDIQVIGYQGDIQVIGHFAADADTFEGS